MTMDNISLQFILEIIRIENTISIAIINKNINIRFAIIFIGIAGIVDRIEPALVGAPYPKYIVIYLSLIHI